MKEDIKSTRTLIKKNKIKDAIELIEEFIPNHLENDLLLLSASFAQWGKEKMLGLAPPIEQRNKSIYGILELVSEIELEYLDGKDNRNLIFRKKLESNLTKGYELLYELKTNNLSEGDFLQKLKLYPNDSLGRLKKHNSKLDIETIIRELIKKNERIYKLVGTNFILSVISIISPIIWGNIDIVEEITKTLEDSEVSENENDIDIE